MQALLPRSSSEALPPDPLWKWEVTCGSAVSFRFNAWKNSRDTPVSEDWHSNEEIGLDSKHPTYLHANSMGTNAHVQWKRHTNTWIHSTCAEVGQYINFPSNWVKTNIKL